MSEREEYMAGVPCWVDTTSPDPQAARDFYGGLFAWEIEAGAEYTIARLGERAVAGIGSAPLASWNTYVRVADAEATVERAVAAGATVLLGPVGGIAVVADTAGAVLCVREALGAQLVNEPGAWMMSSLHTPDLSAATAFYGAVFGWEPEPLGPLTLLRLPGYTGGEPGQPIPRDVVAAIAPPVPAEHVPPHWNVNFRVADADAVVERVPALGGAVLAAPFDTPGFRSAVIQDPNGAVFSISEVVLPQPSSRS